MGVYTTKIDPGIKPKEIEAACSRINTHSVILFWQISSLFEVKGVRTVAFIFDSHTDAFISHDLG